MTEKVDWSSFEVVDAPTPVAASANSSGPVDWSSFEVVGQEEKPKTSIEGGGFFASAKQSIGSAIKGAGQLAGDLPGIDEDNALKRYGQSVVEANQTAVRSMEDISDKPLTAVKEAAGSAVGSIGGMAGARALGMGITAAAPFTGPAAPVTALIGQAVSWLGPMAIAALPSYGSIREKQILNDPQNNEDFKSKAIAAMGAATVGAIETKFGPQNWALGAMTKEGRDAIAKKFAETTLAKGIGFGAAKGAAIEGAEEIVQSPVEQIASYEDPTTAKSLKETAFGGAMGAIGGGVFGGAVGGAFHARPTVADISKAESVDDAIAAATAAVESQPTPTAAAATIAELERTAGISTPEQIAELPTVASDMQSGPTTPELTDIIKRGATREEIFSQRESELAAQEASARETGIRQLVESGRDLQLEQATALTRAQGFGEAEPTAMQLAMQQAQARRELLMTPVSQRAETAQVEQAIAQPAPISQAATPIPETANVEPTSATAIPLRNVSATGTIQAAPERVNLERVGAPTVQPVPAGLSDTGIVSPAARISVPGADEGVQQPAAVNRRQESIASLEPMTSKQLRGIATSEKRAYMRNAAAEILQVRSQETRLKRSELAKKIYVKSKQIDPDRDTMAQAIAKLGGINSESAAGRMRLAPEELNIRGHGVLRVFSKAGRSMDEIGAQLADLGYVQHDANGKYDQSDFEDKLGLVAGGAEVLTPNGMMQRAQENHDQAMQEVGATSPEEYAAIESDIEQVPDDVQKFIDDAFDNTQLQGALSDEEIDRLFEPTGGNVPEITAARPSDEVDQGNQAPPAGDEDFLQSESEAEANARLAAAKEKTRLADLELKRLDEVEKHAKIQKEIDQRQAASAENFQLGQTAEEAISGQGNLLEQKRDEYTKDLFGESISPAPRENRRPANEPAANKPINMDAADAILDQSRFASRTKLAVENTRQLGASSAVTMDDAAQAMSYLGRGAVERFDALVTDKDGKPLAVVGAFKGAIAQASVYPSTVIGEAFRIKGAANIWFAHNHPSGTPHLSQADHNLYGILRESFRGSAIEPRGLLAIAGGVNESRDWSMTDGARTYFGSTSAAKKTTNVPSVERQYEMDGTLGPAISSPSAAKKVAVELANGESGILLLDVRNRPLAFVPVDVAMPLRASGRMDALYRAISVANSGASMIVNNGGLDGPGIRNLGALLNSVDSRLIDVFDVVDGKTESWAEQGATLATDVFYSQGKVRRIAGISAAEVIKATARLRAKWLGFTKVNTVQSINDLPAHILDRVKPGAQTEGFYDPQTQSVYLIADNILSPDHAALVASHEVIGHGGLRMLKDKTVTDAVNIAGANRFVRELSAAIAKDRGGLAQNTATEEAIAEMAAAIETNDFQALTDRYGVTVPDSAKNGIRGTIARVIDAVKRFIVSVTGKPVADVSDADVRSLIAAQRESVETTLNRREPTGGAMQEALFSTPPTQWISPESSRLDDFLYVMQDKHIDTKRVVETITKVSGQIQDELNPRLQETLFSGRSASATQEFLKKELKPLYIEMQASKVGMEELEEYLHVRHAKERNAQIAKINPKIPDGGSGMKNADADAYMTGLTPEKARSYASLAKRIDAINTETQKLLIDSGLEKQSTIDTWNATYKHYVPLHRDDVGDGRPGIGQGFSVRGASTKRAMGSTKEVIDILANIVMQRERTILRAEKNPVSMATYGLAIQQPNKEFWLPVNPNNIPSMTPQQYQEMEFELISLGLDPADAANVMAEPKQRYIDPRTGLVAERINPILRSAPNVLALRVNGEDRFVFFSEKDPRAQRMVTALKNLDADQLGVVLAASAKASRWFASVNTQYNPVFGMVNFTRDIQSALLSLSTTEIAGKQKAVLGESTRLFIKLAAKRFRMESLTGADAALWQEFQKEGGKTGFRDMFANSADRAKALQSEINQISEGKIKGAGRAIFNWLSDYNESLESIVRIATYKVAKENGVSNQRAAAIAKNLMNFNRKGTIALQAGALYAFFNASAQGTMKVAQTLAGPAGKKIITGGLLLGVMQAFMLAAAGFDDDEPPEFVKERSLVIPTFGLGGEGKYIAIPMPLGFNVIPSFSRIVTEWALSGGENTARKIADIFALLAGSFNPIGNAGLSIQTIAPTAVDPFVALSENRDFTGRPIAREDLSGLKQTPGYTRAKDTASEWSKTLSYYLNLVSGGTKYQPGTFSPTPDQIDYLIGQVTGGVGREITKTAQAVTSKITGEELPPHKIPLIGRFYGDTKGHSAEASKFYDNLKRLNGHKLEIEGRREHKEDVSEYLRENKDAMLIKAGEKMQRRVSELNKMKRALIEKDAPKERIKMIEERVAEEMKSLNDRMASLQE